MLLRDLIKQGAKKVEVDTPEDKTRGPLLDGSSMGAALT
jgi:hypothetical protein